jgi:hypothetical protein
MTTAPTSLAVLPKTCDALDQVADEFALSRIAGLSSFRKTFMLAAGVQRLRQLITPEIMGPIMELQGTSLGFRTDKDKTGGYPMETVKEVAIEAILRGALMVGNEVNIIADRLYLTKEHFARVVREYPGLTDLKISLGVPKTQTGGAIVTGSAAWKFNGKADTLSREIPVRVNAGMGCDAILGKATRKLLASIFGQLTGSQYSENDGEVEDVIDVPAMPALPDTAGQKQKFGFGKPKGEQAAKPAAAAPTVPPPATAGGIDQAQAEAAKNVPDPFAEPESAPQE